MNEHEDAARQVGRMFLSGRPRPRAKPHRCLGCGKVSATIFCRKTTAECKALYRERQP